MFRIAGSVVAAAAVAAFLVPAASAFAVDVVTTPTGVKPPPKVPVPAPRDLTAPGRLWATVNVCDTAGHPDTVGIGASMPGSRNPKHELYMRFQVQFRAPTGVWKYVGPTGDSDFQLVGTGATRSVQAGHNFTMQAPVKGQIVVRGEVTFEWRKGPKVLYRAKRLTSAGHPKTAGGDPKRFSAPLCLIKPDLAVVAP